MTRPPHSVEAAPGTTPSEMQSVLHILHTLIRERAAANEAAQKREARQEEREEAREARQAARDARLEGKIDHLTADIESLKADNRRQDRVQSHDGAVAQEALTIAAAKAGGQRGGWWGALAGIAAALVTSAGLVAVEWIKSGGMK